LQAAACRQVFLQIPHELRHLRELDRSSRSSVNVNDIVQTLTKPVDQAMEFIPVEQREVHVGERAEHRKFKVTGEVVSIDGQKAFLNVNGRKVQVEVKDLVPVAGPQPKGPKTYKSAKAQPGKGDDAVPASAELNLIGQRVDDALEESD